MGIASVGARGTNTSKTSGTTLTVQPSDAVAAGDILVVWTAWDNNNASTADGPMSRQMACQDDAGNLYCTIYGGQDTTANARCMVFIFVSRITTALTTSSTLTLTHFNTAAPKVAKAVSLHEFSLDPGMTWAITGDQGPQQVTTRAADPGAISLSGLASQEYLMLHALGAEGPSTDTYTWDADYTQIATAGTTGGVDDTNMTINGGYRIATLTGDTVDVTALTAFRDYTQGFQALCQVPIAVDTPTSPVLDSFDRADEDPLDGGLWDTGTCTAGSSSTLKLRILSNAATSSSTASSESDGQWMLSTETGTWQEVWATLSTAVVATAATHAILVMCGSGCRNTTTLAGYQADWAKANTTDGTATDNIRLGKETSNSTANPKIICHVALADGCKWGEEIRDNAVHLWVDPGSGWRDVGAIYFTTLLTGGKRGLAVGPSPSAQRVSEFGGGPHIATAHLLPILGVGP